jgi:8-oxo-dGTP diphosphatase
MRKSRVILTNMVMLYRPDGSFLVENRLKQDWPGLNFPGGHVEDAESMEESARREIKEETGFVINKLECMGYFEWNVPSQEVRHFCVLFRSQDFAGTLTSSSEGPVFWIKEEDIKNYPLSTDFDKVLLLMRKGL